MSENLLKLMSNKEESREQVAKRLRITEAKAQDAAYKRGLATEKASAERRKDRNEDIRAD